MVPGSRKVPDKINQPARVGAVVAVDRLIIVADPEHSSAPSGEQANHQQVGWCEILELIDEEHTADTLGGAPGLRLRQQHFNRSIDLIVEIDRALTFHRRSKMWPHLDQPGDVTAVTPLDFSWLDQTEPDQAQCVEPTGERVDVEFLRQVDES